ncbi:dihydroorotate dehydrogenase, partial [Linnemannia gamsii]
AITKAIEKPQIVVPAHGASSASGMHSPRLGPSSEFVAPSTPLIRPSDGRRGSVQMEHSASSSVVVPTHVAAAATRDVPSVISRILNNSPFLHRHILSSKQFDRNELHTLFSLAHEMRTQVERNGSIDLLHGKVMCSMFYEPSTRTSCSFQAAMLRLGGTVVGADGSSSSVVKGETLADTVRTLGCYGDLIVLRHPAPGSAATAAKFSK